MDDVLILVSETKSKDEYGVDRKSFTNKQVFAKANTVNRQEFFMGGRNGLNPSFSFTVFAGDYSGEAVCQFHGEQFSIYRTYHVPGTDYLELYVERKGGTNHVEEDSD